MYYELTETEERELAAELANDLDTYISNELCDQLYEMTADLLRRHGADPDTDFGLDLIHSLASRLVVATR